MRNKSGTRQAIYIGLMSGTSADAVDAAIVAISPSARIELLHTVEHPLEADLRGRLLHAASHPDVATIAQLAALDHQMGAVFAETALAAIREAGLKPSSIRAIGSHGQTVFHAPNASHPNSLQIGDPNVIAARTGITTVSDFRRRDIALGGQGAPLAPAFHRAVFFSPDENRCVVNIGGIANITLLGSDGGILGFDTGPGNGLMDAWAMENLGQPFDADGTWAASGRVDEPLLRILMEDPYFDRHPPKSTGRDHFNPAWLRERLAGTSTAPEAATVQRTLCALTARTIAEEIVQFSAGNTRILLCGGGARNGLLKQDLQTYLKPWPVETTANYGVSPDWVEACAFAWFAMRTLNRRPGNEPDVTGARQATVLGAIYPG